MSVFTDNLANIKRIFNLSANQIARMACVPPSTIMRIQSDEHKPSLRTIERLSIALGIDSSDLLFDRIDDEYLAKNPIRTYRNFGSEPDATLDLRLKMIESDLSIIKKHLGITTV